MNLRGRLTGLIKRIFASTLSRPQQWLLDWATDGVKASSGESVNERTALGLSTYLACIKNISEDLGKLPLGIYKRLEPRGRSPLPQHPVSTLLHNSPNEEMSAMSFREVLTSHALGWQGGFAEIVRNGAGVPVALWPLDPTTVQIMREQGGEKRLFYMVDNTPMLKDDIFHLHGLGYDGITGYVIARLANDPIGNALAAQKFAGTFFANGTTTTGVIQFPDAMSDTALKHLRESFHERHSGPEKQHRPMILEQGAEWKAQSTAPRESQMVEVLQNGVEEICRLFRMPPHKAGHLLRSTNNNIEHQALEYVVDTLLAWIQRWEQEIWRKLLRPAERLTLFAKHNLNMLLRGDMTARSAFYREGFGIGWLSDNDIRELEDMNPIDGGDTYFINATFVPLKMAAEGEHLAAKQAAQQPKEPKPEPDTQPQDAMKDHRRELVLRIAAAHRKPIEDAIAALLRVEHDKITRAAKRKDGYAWATEFYQKEHRKYVSERLQPHLAALETSLEGAVCGPMN